MTQNLQRPRVSGLIALAGCLALVLNTTAEPGAQEPTAAAASALAAPEALEALVAAEVERQRIPGAAVAIVQNGAVVSARGYGLANVEHDVPVTRTTLFQSGSVGKQFTAAAVMLQVEAGRLDLDASLRRYFPAAPERWAAITPRHLLTHTSGLPNYTNGLIDFRRDYTEADLLAMAYDLALEFEPGSQWRYSNTGYIVLGALIRAVSGRFYGDVLRDEVFAPLGMRTARVISEADIVPHRADGYRLDDDALRHHEWVAPSLNTTADGSLYVSLDDLIAWAHALRTNAVLRPESWSAIYTPVRLTNGRRVPYGFGWEVDRVGGQSVRRHGGSWQGFKADIALYPDADLTVIVLANLAQARPDAISDAIAARLLPSLAAQATWTLTDATIVDGTGGPPRTGNIRLADGTIVGLGDVRPAETDRVIDATGLVVAPGFIDLHNHSDRALDTHPAAVSQVAQGITTVVLGQDGSSPWPIGQYLARRRATPAAVNTAVFVGHATVRRLVMGDAFRRDATPAEVARMAEHVADGMRAGALGLSSGLEYEVGSYATTDELVALARAAAQHGGLYVSHIRDEADRTFDALREAIAIGERAGAPVHISHIKLGTVGVWGRTQEVVALIDAARARRVDVTADAYPYTAWQSNLKVLVPNRQWTDPESVREALADVGGGRNIQIARLPAFPQWVGKRLDEAAREAEVSEVDLYIRIVADDDAGIIGHTMTLEDMQAFLRTPWVMVASDGGIDAPHPRGAGTFPRVLGRFVRDDGWLTLPAAIHKMTGQPAARLGLRDRGVLAVGARADVVLFDPTTIIDRATFEAPRRLPVGVEGVWVNGEAVWLRGAPAEARPGAVLTSAPRP